MDPSDPIVDYEELGRELVAELRGRQSTRAASLRLGYASNPVLRWERGERTPPADDVLRLAHLQGRDVLGAAASLTNTAVADLGELTPRDPGFVPALLGSFATLLGRGVLAEASGLTRWQIGRMIRGESRIRLPDLLRTMHRANRTLVRFLTIVSDVTSLPAAEGIWAQHDREQAMLVEVPFIFTMLHALELDAYRALPAHDDAWVARLLGLPEHEVAKGFARAAHIGMIREVDGRWEPSARRGLARYHLREAQERAISGQLAEEASRRIRSGLASAAWHMFRISEDGLRKVAVEMARGLDGAADVMAAESGQRLGYAMVILVPMDSEPFALRTGPETD